MGRWLKRLPIALLLAGVGLIALGQYDGTAHAEVARDRALLQLDTTTPSLTPSLTEETTGTPTEAPNASDTPTETPSETPAETATDTWTPSVEPTASSTFTATPTSAPSATNTSTWTPTSSLTPTATATPTPIAPTVTATPTWTPSPVLSPTPGIPSLSPVGTIDTGKTTGVWEYEWDGMSGTQTWITQPGVVWHETSTATVLAYENIANETEIEVCSRGNLPYAEWAGGGARQPARVTPKFNWGFENTIGYRSWICATQKLDLRYTDGTLAIGHHWGSPGRRQPGGKIAETTEVFYWQVWVKRIGDYEFAEPAWPFDELPILSAAEPKAGQGGSSTSSDPRECPISACGNNQGYAGDPINTQTGNYDLTLVDLAMPSAAGPLLFQRSYASAAVDLYTTSLGYGWTYNQDTRLIFPSDPGGEPSMVRFKAHSASQYGFTQSDTDTFLPLPGVLATLTRDPGPPVTYTLTNRVRDTYLFDESGKLLSWSDPQGNSFVYTYDGSDRLSQVSAGSRSITLSYDSSDRIVSATDHTSRSVSFTYDAGGDLVTATDVNGEVWSYAYDGSHRLTEIIDPRGITTLQTDYDSEGRAFRQFDGLGNRIVEISFNGDGTSTITDARGFSRTDTYNGEGHLAASTDALGGATSHTYELSGRTNSTTDPAGNTTAFDWSDDGENLLRVADAGGSETVLSYDNLNNLTDVIDPRGQETSFEYDGRLLTSITNPLGSTTTFEYSSEGFLISATNPLGRKTTFTNSVFGERTSMTDPLGYTWTYTYDSLGRLIELEDPLGRVLLNEFDPAGRPIRTIQNYDPARPQSDLAEYNITTSYSYDAVGNRTAATDSLGRSTVYQFDQANRLIRTTDPEGNISLFLYDEAGNLTRVTDPLERSTEFTYDLLNRMVLSVDPLGNRSSTTYNADGTVASTEDPLGRSTSYSYDALKRLISIVDALGGRTSYAYDALGNLLLTTDPNGHSTSITWDPLSRPVSVTDPNGNRRDSFFDAVGNLLSVSDPLGNTSTYSYDLRNLVSSVQDPLGNITSYRYDAAGNRVGITDANGVGTGYEYDSLDRLVAVVQNEVSVGPVDSQTNVRTQYSYDALGNLVAIQDARGNSRSYAYDLLGRLITETDPLGNSRGYQYDAVGNPVAQTDGEGFDTFFTFDAADRLIAIDYPAADPDVGFTYDAAGNRLEMIDGVGTTRWTYDPLNRVISVNDPYGQLVSYGYDAAGNRTLLRYPDGREVLYGYDPADRLTDVTDWALSQTTYAYDLADRLTAIDLPNGVVSSLSYDAASRMTSLAHASPVDTLASFQYAYDGVGNRISVVETLLYPYPEIASSRPSGSASGKVAASPLLALMAPVALLILAPLGMRRRKKETPKALLVLVVLAGVSLGVAACSTPTPIPTPTWTPTPRFTVTPSATLTPTSTAIPSDTPTPTFTPTDTSTPSPTPTPTPEPRTKTISYTYDPLYRLMAANYSSGEFFRYTYDPVGNRLSQSTVAGTNAYAYDAADRLANVDGMAYSWDANGNLISDGQRSFAYDHANRLASIVDSGSTYGFKYNGLGDRVELSTDGLVTQYTLDLQSNLTQVLQDGTSSYLYPTNGLPRIGGEGVGGWSYELGDALGSIRQLSDPASEILLAQDFEPFGSLLASSGISSSAFGFTGEQSDSTGLQYLRARYYDPSVGRFLTTDPFPGFAALPTTLHPYQYVLNNPTNLVDPSGRFPFLAAAGLGALIGGGAGALDYVLSNPGATPGDYLSSPCFWRSVGTGVAAGAVAGLVAWAVPFLPFLPAGSGIVSAVASNFAVGSLATGAWQVTTNLLMPGRSIGAGVLPAMAAGGIFGAASGAIGYGISRLAAVRATVPQPSGGFSSFRALKRALGPARERNVWHHLVEQRSANVQRFGAEVVHNPANVVAVSGNVNQQIANYYSRIRPFTGGRTVRMWLGTQSFEEQLEFGAKILSWVLQGKPLP
ncbi:MAG: RHS repeat-associated core domain-containing protein [Anaerolineales bacterium]